MRRFSLILWLSILLCAFPAFAQNITVHPSAAESMKAYNERWIETGSECIRTLLRKAKIQRKQIWNDRFPDLKTLCVSYERYWYFANSYADGIGIVREKQEYNWIKNALETRTSNRNYPYQQMDLKLIQKFRQEIDEFAGSGSILLVDEAIPRFNFGQVYTLDGDKYLTPAANNPWSNTFFNLFTGDFWPQRQRFWGDSLAPGRKD